MQANTLSGIRTHGTARSSARDVVVCGDCRRTIPVRISTSGDGRLVTTGDWCVHERRRRGICLDCPRPVEGDPRKALRCRGCKLAARVASRKRSEARRKADPARVAARREQENERWRSDAAFRERKAARKRSLHRARMATDPKYRKAYRERRKAEHPREDDPRRADYLAYMASYNEGRRDSRREWHLWKRGKSDLRFCRGCGDLVGWKGRGRPKRLCARCQPYAGELAAARVRAIAWECYTRGLPPRHPLASTAHQTRSQA